MWCCGSSDDNSYTVTPYRPIYEQPHHSVSPHRYPQHVTRDPKREEWEKWQRQKQATAAAQRYGWPTSRSPPGGNDHLQTPGNRDSLIEPTLAGDLAAMPGVDFGAVYDPNRPPRPPNYSSNPPQRTQRPPHDGRRVVNQQPHRMPPMNAPPRQQPTRPQAPVVYKGPTMPMPPTHAPPRRAVPKKDVRAGPPVAPQRPPVSMPPRNPPPAWAQPKKYARAESPVVHERPGLAREVIIQKQPSPPREPEMARFSLVPLPTRATRRHSRDENRVSLCSDDGLGIPRNCVSPLYE